MLHTKQWTTKSMMVMVMIVNMTVMTMKLKALAYHPWAELRPEGGNSLFLAATQSTPCVDSIWINLRIIRDKDFTVNYEKN